MYQQRSRRHTIAIAAASVLGLLAGCGQSDGSSAEAPATTAAAAVKSASTTADTASGSTGDGASTTGANPVATTDGAGEAAAAGSAPEECSTDGSETTLDPLATDVVPVAVNAASAQSPLPDLTLRRINCNPGFVNLKNELPAATPVLFWFWAPF